MGTREGHPPHRRSVTRRVPAPRGSDALTLVRDPRARRTTAGAPRLTTTPTERTAR
ncbi:hypothetical protein [Micromonospora pallida]|uniref:hypothetical protein n=1 Tax=Micromonospora pallida TaxID=145854 RepID=UPI00159F0158|nr:hypothetical protein [Micromonospora pallida]